MGEAGIVTRVGGLVCWLGGLMLALSPVAACAAGVAPLAGPGTPPVEQGLPVTRAALTQEMGEKLARVQAMLARRGLDGVVITSVRNFSWITAGMADNHVVITSEIGAASLVVMRDGRRFVVASSSEMPRLTEEGLRGLGFVPREFRWFEDKTAPDRKQAILSELAAGGRLGTDTPIAGLVDVDADLARLRFPLTATELAKYRWLGKNATAAVESVCRQIVPGMSEREIEALTSDALMRRGIRPTVLLIGTDERIFRYRHAVPSEEGRLGRYGMVNVCARRWGLVIALTRFVHFGPVPAELTAKLRAAAIVNTALIARSQPGATGDQLIRVAQKAYAEVGFPDEWRQHHQGGPIGYGERDWVAFPGSTDVVGETETFAWNPSIRGAKVEDTVLVTRSGVENLTASPDWPTITVQHSGLTMRAPDILVRTAGR